MAAVPRGSDISRLVVEAPYTSLPSQTCYDPHAGRSGTHESPRTRSREPRASPDADMPP